jgi:diguanylate cyclase (GGDEF)-like protein
MTQLDNLFDELSERFWKFGIYGIWAAAFIHAVFIFMFWSLDVFVMAYFNVFSVLLFLYCLYLVRHRQYKLLLTLSHIEVVVHALLATYMVGYESGFYYYLFILVIIAFISIHISVFSKVIKLMILLGLFFGVEFFFTMHAPMYQVDEMLLLYLRSFNLFGFLLIAFPVIYFHVRFAFDTEKMLYEYATVDPLTGLNNRRFFVSIAEHEFTKRKRSNIAMILTDIDHFKKINDTYGHDAGDHVLKNIAALLMDEKRDDDLLARWGGEEFLFLLPDTTLEEAYLAAERIRAHIESGSISYSDTVRLTITSTFGVVERRDNETFDETLARADIALYEGKHTGRNMVLKG